MFKNFLNRPGIRLCKGMLLLLALAGWFGSGCQTSRPFPPVDLRAPDWTIRSGQAVWCPGTGTPEIAGELLVATRADGTSFVQFTKTPFPMIEALQTPSRWYLEIPTRNQRYSAPGAPPKRLIWLWLPRLLAGQPVPKHWVWRQNGQQWQLTAGHGETLRGFLEP